MNVELTLPGELLKAFFFQKPIKYKLSDHEKWNEGTLDFVPLGNGKCFMSIFTTKNGIAKTPSAVKIPLTPDTIELLQYHSGEAMFYLSFSGE